MTRASSAAGGRVPQAEAKAVARRLLEHRMLESRVGHEFFFPWEGRNPFRLERRPSGGRQREAVDRRMALSEAQNHRCCYCAIQTTRAGPHMATIEHVKAKSKGGTDDWTNLAMACLRCNALRRNDDAYAFFDRRVWEDPA